MLKFRFICVVSIMFITLQLSSQYRYSHLHLGRQELAQDNYHKAIGYLSFYIKDHPGIYEGYYLRGLAKFYLDDLVGAEADFNMAISCLPQFPQLYMLRGIVRAESFKLNQANTDFNTAIEKDSMFTAAYFYRALNYMNLREFELAYHDVDHVVQLDSAYPNAHILRGAVAAELSFYDEAVREFTWVLNKDTANSKALNERGKVYAKLNQTQNALKDFNAVLAIDSTDGQALFNRGLLYVKLLEYELALADLNQVIELSPDNELAYFNRAVISHNKNMNANAIDDYINILNRNPDNLLVYYNMGLSFARLGQYNQAVKCFSTAIAIYPNYADAYLQRAMVAREIGDMKAGEHDYDKYEQLLQQNQAKNDSIKQLEGLEILRLSHLSADFLKQGEKKNRLQYLESEVDLRPPFQMNFDSVFITDNFNTSGEQLSYYLKSISLIVNTDTHELQVAAHYNQIDSLRLAGLRPGKYYQLRGLLHLYEGKLSEAVFDFDTALSYNPSAVEVLFNRANARMALLNIIPSNNSGDNQLYSGSNSGALLMYSDIIHDYNKVLAIQPDFIYARYNLGYLKYLMADYAGALREFNQVAMKNKIAEAHYNKALLEHYFNNTPMACTQLGIAGELGLEEAYSALRKFCK